MAFHSVMMIICLKMFKNLEVTGYVAKRDQHVMLISGPVKWWPFDPDYGASGSAENGQG